MLDVDSLLKSEYTTIRDASASLGLRPEHARRVLRLYGVGCVGVIGNAQVYRREDIATVAEKHSKDIGPRAFPISVKYD